METMCSGGAVVSPARPRGVFQNPMYPGADPWLVQHEGWYYFCQAGPGGRLEVWKSPSMVHRGECRIVWSPPRRGWNRAQVWAPELHFVRGRWYIYYAASDGKNRNHRMGVLESAGNDPQGPYVDRGMLNTADRWAIDGTVLDLHGNLYFIWSGWEHGRDIQHLYGAEMSDPHTIRGNRVRLCDNDCHVWERVGECRHQRGLHEGPQILRRNGQVFLIYSCSASWQAGYKLGMLRLDERSDPLSPGSWIKHPRPVFESTGDVFGVGHCCFVQSPDRTEDWIVYHSKQHRREGWERVVRAQPFGWTEDGIPDFGRPTSSGWMRAPSGEEIEEPLPMWRNESGMAA